MALDPEKVKALRKNDTSVIDIAEEFGVSRQAIYSCMWKHEID